MDETLERLGEAIAGALAGSVVGHWTAHDELTITATARDIVKVTTFLLDIGDRARINPVRQEVFGDVRPASTLVEVSALAVPGALLEIEAVAAIAS